jgi:hypothetical protein
VSTGIPSDLGYLDETDFIELAPLPLRGPLIPYTTNGSRETAIDDRGYARVEPSDSHYVSVSPAGLWRFSSFTEILRKFCASPRFYQYLPTVHRYQ